MRFILLALVLAVVGCSQQKEDHRDRVDPGYLTALQDRTAVDCMRLKEDILTAHDAYWTVKTSDTDAGKQLEAAELAAKWQHLLGCK